MPVLTQRSFTGGELSPSLHVRADLAKYQNSVAVGYNVFPHVEGGISNRPGLEFIGEVKDSSKITRLIGFEFNIEQAYALEFSENAMRVHKDGGQVLETAQAIVSVTKASVAVMEITGHNFLDGEEIYVDAGGDMTEINSKNFLVANKTANTVELQTLAGVNVNSTNYTTYTTGGTAARVYKLTTTYADADIFDLYHVQSGDTLTVVESGYAPRDITRTGHSAWTLANIDFSIPLSRPLSLTLGTFGTASGATNKSYEYVVSAVNSDGVESLPSILKFHIINALSVTWASLLEWSAPGSKAIVSVTKADPAVMEVTGHGWVTGDTIHVDSGGDMTEINNTKFHVTRLTDNTVSLQTVGGTDIDSTSYTTYTSGGKAGEVNDIEHYLIYKAESRGSGVYGYIGKSESLDFKDFNIAPDMSIGIVKNNIPFTDSGDRPSTVGYYQQRQIFGSTNNDPQKIFMSESGNYSSMRTHTPVVDSDSVQFTIASRKVNRIRHLISIDALLLLTSGGEWIVSEGMEEVITPTTIGVKQQSYNGADAIEPLLIDNTALYVQYQGSRVRDIGYTFESDSYTGSDLTVLSRHLFKDAGQTYTIVDWAYQKEPFGIVWAVRSDGKLLSLTYQREQQVWGWCLHETDGLFESVCAIPEGDEDSVYFIIKRTIGDVAKRYVERLHTREMTDVSDAFFVDSGLTYDNPLTISGATQADPVVLTVTGHGLSNGARVHPSTITGMTELNGGRYLAANVGANTLELQTLKGVDVDGTGFTEYESGGELREAVTVISNLNHIEGKDVAVLSDGVVVNGLTVSGGQITLPEPGGKNHVGLAYNSRVGTLDIDAAERTVRHVKKSVAEVTLSFKDSRGGYVGPDWDRLKELPPRNVSDGYNLIPLSTYTVTKSIEPGWSDGGRVCYEQIDPLPFTLLGITPSFDIG